MTDRSHSAAAWKYYDDQTKNVSFQPNDVQKSFDEGGIHFGSLDTNLALEVGELIRSAKVDIFRREDTSPGYVTCAFDSETVKKIARGSKFRVFSSRETWILEDMLLSIKTVIAQCLGTPWRILNFRAWTTPPSSEEFGMYGWHSDGFIPEIFKIMIYFTPLSERTGGIHFRLNGEEKMHLADQAGAWVLFKNTEIIHRGVPGTEAERTSVEVTISRSPQFDLKIRYPGQNAHWPEFPWTVLPVDCTVSESKIASFSWHNRSV